MSRRVGRLAALALGCLPAAVAGPLLYVERGGLLCDTAETVCLRGTLTYQPNERLLRLRGRVQFAPGPGELRILMTGENRRGDRRYAPMEITLRGKYSEIVDFKMIPDHPDVDAWQIDRISFAPEGED